MSVFLADYVERQQEWSRATFGPGKRTIGITEHIKKECEEIRADPTDLEEWIDVIILAIDGFWRHGGKPNDLRMALHLKQQRNAERRWPAPQPEDQPAEHLR